MKLFILSMVCLPSLLFGQVFTLTHEDNTSTTKPAVIIGFVKGATDGIDAVLGEKELPPLHPINGAHIVSILDMNKDGSFSSSVDMFSYRDIRNTEPLSVADTFWVQVSPWKADKKWMKFSWEYPLGTGIDSVVLTDKGGMALRILCDAKKSHTILPNEFGVGPITIEDFHVIIYRSQGASSIENDDYTIAKNSDIYSSNGVLIAKNIDTEHVKHILQDQSFGVYFIRTGSSVQSIVNYK
ncbi:MAG: hypothetical protein ACKOX1_04110 [Ignavibacteria bacterium]